MIRVVSNMKVKTFFVKDGTFSYILHRKNSINIDKEIYDV